MLEGIAQGLAGDLQQVYCLVGRNKTRRQLIVEPDVKAEMGAVLLAAGLQRGPQAGFSELQAEGGQQLPQLGSGGVQFITHLAE